MPLVQIRDVPEHIYRSLTEQAEKERRSLSQQAIVVLARGLRIELDAKAKRRNVLQIIKAGGQGKLSDPAKMIRADRRR